MSPTKRTQTTDFARCVQFSAVVFDNKVEQHSAPGEYVGIYDQLALSISHKCACDTAKIEPILCYMTIIWKHMIQKNRK